LKNAVVPKKRINLMIDHKIQRTVKQSNPNHVWTRIYTNRSKRNMKKIGLSPNKQILHR
jgi:hypothetical protein